MLARDNVNRLLEMQGGKPKYIITDFFTNIDQVSKETLTGTPQWSIRFLRLFSAVPILNPALWIVLILLGILSALAAFLIDLTSTYLLQLKVAITSTDYYALNLSIWVLFSVAFSLLAGVSGKFPNSDAEGSGIPEMKAIISGVHIAKYFNFTKKFSFFNGFFNA